MPTILSSEVKKCHNIDEIYFFSIKNSGTESHQRGLYVSKCFKIGIACIA